MTIKQPKLKIQKRAPYGALLSLCKPVHDIDAERPWIYSLISYLYKNKLESIAANQAGYNRQVFITDVKGDHIRVFVNPILTITDYSQDLVEESCCSYPRSNVARHRHAHVIVDYLTLKGSREILDTADPMYGACAKRLSHVIQHEMEHLFGLNVREEPDLQTGQPSLSSLCSSPLQFSTPPDLGNSGSPEFYLGLCRSILS